MRRGSARRHLGDSAGVAAVEFALVAPVLILLMVGTVDIGTAYWEKTEVDNAAWAGAVYAGANGDNTSGIAAAMNSATGLSSIQSSVGQPFAGCPSASGITNANASNCSDGTGSRTYVTVTASVAYSPVLPYPGFGSMTLTSNVTARVQ